MSDFLAAVIGPAGLEIIRPTPMKGWAYARFAEAERFDGRISFDGFTTAKNLVIGS
jgi:hypothetical protein